MAGGIHNAGRIPSFMSFAGYGIGAVMTVQGAKHRMSKGEGAFSAYAKEIPLQAMWAVMPLGPAMALSMLPAVPALTRATIASWQARSGYLRSAQTPFSQRFEHSDATAAAMQRGLSAISESRGNLGTEAFSMARRYSRG